MSVFRAICEDELYSRTCMTSLADTCDEWFIDNVHFTGTDLYTTWAIPQFEDQGQFIIAAYDLSNGLNQEMYEGVIVL